jgi:hypothetical protein
VSTPHANVTGMSSQKRYAVRMAEAQSRWSGILPWWYWRDVVGWEQHVVAKTMADAGFSSKDIARALGVKPARARDLVQYQGSHPGELYRYHKERRSL